MPRRPLRALTSAALPRGRAHVCASAPSAKGAPPPSNWDRKRSGSQARASALTAARALTGHTCTRLWVEHSMAQRGEEFFSCSLTSGSNRSEEEVRGTRVAKLPEAAFSYTPDRQLPCPASPAQTLGNLFLQQVHRPNPVVLRCFTPAWGRGSAASHDTVRGFVKARGVARYTGSRLGGAPMEQKSNLRLCPILPMVQRRSRSRLLTNGLSNHPKVETT